ncbi:MAG TPA: IclR family transcriptional regulator [Sphingomonas sp.]|jgi:DNA-binding IclR family transcriptional regulator|uniref:IclR family transcriptional regulator n=1 Tax=Sphingomonas sp. TaxID=28214 RepID=UPI002ED9681B
MNRIGPKGTYAAPALEKAFEIIELLADHPDGALVSEMAARLGRSVGELFRIVIVMEKHGYLQKSAKTDRYTVAYKILDLAYRATPAQNLARAAMPEMQQLARDIGQSCHLVVPNGGHGLVIAREENPGTRGFSLKLGASIDLIVSCSGQVILAFSSAQNTERMLDLAAALDDRPVDRPPLMRRLKKVRDQGFDSRKSPITYGVTDISFPVFGFDGELAGALTIPFLELIDGSQKVKIDAARERLRDSTTAISATLGHHMS